MKVLKCIKGLPVFTLAYERNEMKYVRMNEADSVFAKEGSLVEPYVEP